MHTSIKQIKPAKRMSYLLMVFGTVLLFTGCRTEHDDPLPFYRDAKLTPEWIEPSAPEYASIHTISEFALTDQDGASITRGDLMGKIYVANFFFSHCKGICPTMRTNLSKVQAAFETDDEVRLVSHTVTPESDTVPVLHNYAKVNGVIAGKWHLLTGAKEEMYALARDAYFVEFDTDEVIDTSTFFHTENFVLVDQQGRIRGVYNGTLAFDVKRLIEDIRTLKRVS